MAALCCGRVATQCPPSTTLCFGVGCECSHGLAFGAGLVCDERAVRPAWFVILYFEFRRRTVITRVPPVNVHSEKTAEDIYFAVRVALSKSML